MKFRRLCGFRELPGFRNPGDNCPVLITIYLHFDHNQESLSMPESTPEGWNQRYVNGTTPWDSGLVEPELMLILDQLNLPSGTRALEYGCGTGTNAIHLAQRGLQTTALDYAPLALERAKAKADAAGVTVDFLSADLCRFNLDLKPVDFAFDRACYHCVRQVNLPGFLETLARTIRPGGYYLMLAGNPDGTMPTPMPKVTAATICTELEPLFAIQQLRTFTLRDPGDVPGPLCWSCLMTRRGN